MKKGGMMAKTKEIECHYVVDTTGAYLRGWIFLSMTADHKEATDYKYAKMAEVMASIVSNKFGKKFRRSSKLNLEWHENIFEDFFGLRK
jgi:hypothetical protein